MPCRACGKINSECFCTSIQRMEADIPFLSVEELERRVEWFRNMALIEGLGVQTRKERKKLIEKIRCCAKHQARLEQLRSK